VPFKLLGGVFFIRIGLSQNAERFLPRLISLFKDTARPKTVKCATNLGEKMAMGDTGLELGIADKLCVRSHMPERKRQNAHQRSIAVVILPIRAGVERRHARPELL
jgi:hypothetical protein